MTHAEQRMPEDGMETGRPAWHTYRLFIPAPRQSHWRHSMSLLSRLQPKLGRYAVPNLTVIVIIGQVFLYIASQIDPVNGANLLDRLRFYPEKVLEGQVWRVVTFLFEPPGSNVVFAFFFWYLFYLFGTTLEISWGTFRYNVYLLIGYWASVAAAFALYFSGQGFGMPASSGFLYGTVFLAFARLYPDFVMTIFFVLPVKVKWLALLQWIGYAMGFLFGTWMIRAMIAASVANYLLFFGRELLQELRHSHRRMRFQTKAMGAQRLIVHKCQCCGVSSDDEPKMQFRYCSKCEGDCCYCPEHLRNHEHVVAAAESAAGEK
jgi:hypothetical protein